MARVTLAGELDIATAPQLERALRRLEVDPALVFLDLRELEFMDSGGVHLILAADRRVRSAGGQLVIVRGRAQVDRLFALTGIDFQLEVVDQPPAAIWERLAGVSNAPHIDAEVRTVAVDCEIHLRSSFADGSTLRPTPATTGSWRP